MNSWNYGDGVVVTDEGGWVAARGTAFPASDNPRKRPPHGAIFWRTDFAAWYYWDRATESWLAIEGAGTPGPQGDQGDPGPQGADGADGPQGPQGDDGAAGAQGAQGAAGAPGPQGDDGAAGPQGDDGAAGPQGAAGADSTVPGPQGNQGFQGFQGTQGVPGSQGNQGNQGNQGFQGTQGTQGFQGFQGFQGAAGAAGSGVQTEFSVQGNQVSCTAQTETDVFATISVPQSSKWRYSATVGLQPAAGTQGVQVGIQCSVAGATVEGIVMGPQTTTALKSYRQTAQGVGTLPTQNVAGAQSVQLEGYIVAPGSGSPAIGVRVKGVQASQGWYAKANAILMLSKVP